MFLLSGSVGSSTLAGPFDSLTGVFAPRLDSGVSILLFPLNIAFDPRGRPQ